MAVALVVPARQPERPGRARRDGRQHVAPAPPRRHARLEPTVTLARLDLDALRRGLAHADLAAGRGGRVDPELCGHAAREDLRDVALGLRACACAARASTAVAVASARTARATNPIGIRSAESARTPSAMTARGAGVTRPALAARAVKAAGEGGGSTRASAEPVPEGVVRRPDRSSCCPPPGTRAATRHPEGVRNLSCLTGSSSSAPPETALAVAARRGGPPPYLLVFAGPGTARQGIIEAPAHPRARRGSRPSAWRARARPRASTPDGGAAPGPPCGPRRRA